MLMITVELLHGTIRAAGLEDSTLTGRASPEWPPSPARIYQALVAGDGTGIRCRVTSGVQGLHLLETPPVIHAVAGQNAPDTHLLGRFVPIDKADKGTVMNYPGRSSQLVRPGARIAPSVPVVRYLWPDAYPTPLDLQNLQVRAARIGYIGTSDSPARVTVSDTIPVDDLPRWEPDVEGDTLLPVPFPGYLDELDAAFDAFTSGGAGRASWTERVLCGYRSPEQPAPDPPAPRTIWLIFDRPLAGRRVVRVAEALRARMLQEAERIVGRDSIPVVLHGHHPRGQQNVEHIRYLPLPFAGRPNATGQIYGACLWLPPGTSDDDFGLLEAAASRIADIRLPAPVAVRLHGGEARPESARPSRWLRSSRVWATAFPMVHERRVKQGLTLKELSLWCSWAGLPEPTSFRSAPVPLIKGAVNLTPAETGQNRAPRPYHHLELTFADAVAGPIAVGRGRHFGLGLLAQTDGMTGA